jgi:hypothetical protein
MTASDIVSRLYKSEHDALYFIRLLNFLILKRMNFVVFFIPGKDIKVKPLHTGVLEDKTNKICYNSLYEFYNAVSDEKMNPTDTEIFSKIYVSTNFNIKRLISVLEEKDVLSFIDQKYRSFLIHNDIRRRVKSIKNMSWTDAVYLEWDNCIYKLERDNIVAEDDILNMYKVSEFLDSYEDRLAENVYVLSNNKKVKHLLSSM